MSVLCLIANPAEPALDYALVAAVHAETGEPFELREEGAPDTPSTPPVEAPTLVPLSAREAAASIIARAKARAS